VVATLAALLAEGTRADISTSIGITGIDITPNLAMRAVVLRRGAGLESARAHQAQRAAARTASAGRPRSTNTARPAHEGGRGNQPPCPRGARLGMAETTPRCAVRRRGRNSALVCTALADARDGIAITGADPTTIEGSPGAVERPGHSRRITNSDEILLSMPDTILAVTRSGTWRAPGNIFTSGLRGAR
jgi:hypothetical protein